MLGTKLALAALAGSPAVEVALPAEIVVPLEYGSFVGEQHAEELPDLSGYTFLECSFEPPAGDWKLPELSTERPLYGRLTLGDAEILCILDLVKESGFFYDRLYCDVNANRDLTDDEVILSNGSRASSYFSTDAIDLVVPVGGERLPYCLTFFAYGSIKPPSGSELELKEAPDSIRIMARSCCAYSGRFEMAGESYRVVLGDGELNGYFDDVARLGDESELEPDQALRPVGDVFWIGGEDGGERRDGCSLGDLLLIAGRLWNVRVDFPERKLILSPYVRRTTRLRLPAKLERLHLSVAAGNGQLVAYQPGEIMVIPTGECRPIWYQIYDEDEQGDDWYVEGTATPETTAIQAVASVITDVRLGPPFEPRAGISSRAYEAFAEEQKLEDVRIGFFITGSGNERVTEILHLDGSATEIELEEDRRRPKEPTFAIVDADGKRVVGGAFRYG